MKLPEFHSFFAIVSDSYVEKFRAKDFEKIETKKQAKTHNPVKEKQWQRFQCIEDEPANVGENSAVPAATTATRQRKPRLWSSPRKLRRRGAREPHPREYSMRNRIP